MPEYKKENPHLFAFFSTGAALDGVSGNGLPSWAQTFANASAVAVLAFLFLLNLTQVCIYRSAAPAAGTGSAAAPGSFLAANPAVSLLGLLLFINILRVRRKC